MDQTQQRQAAVYERALAYNDENFYFNTYPPLQQLLTQWREGGDIDPSQAWAAMYEMVEEPDRLVSTHDSIDRALEAARSHHVEACAQLTFVDLGFETFGCQITNLDDEFTDEASSFGDDLPKLKTWCSENGVAMPSLDSTDPGVRKICEAISQRALEGDLWMDFLEDKPDGASPFAADMVADELRATGKADLAADLFTHLVCDLTYVGPPPSSPQTSAKPSHIAKPERKGFLGRLFGK